MSFPGGLTLKRGDGLEPETFTAIAGVLSLSNIGEASPLVKITGWDSTVEDYTTDTPEGNEITMEVIYKINSSIQQDLINDAKNRTKVNYQLSMDDGIDLDIFEFTLLHNAWGISPVHEDRKVLSISAKIVSDIIHTKSIGGGGFWGGAGVPVGGVLGDYYWPMNEQASSNLVESLSGTVTLFENIGPPDEPSYNQPSLRSDSDGSAIRYNTIDGHVQNNFAVAYSGGFTVEAIVKLDAVAANGADRVGYGVYASYRTFSNRPGWVMWFDNFNDNSTGDVFPCFTLTNTTYVGGADYATSVESEIRSSLAATLGNIYHLLATIRPSDNTIEFWVNGVSVGSTSINSTWFEENNGSGFSKLDGSSTTIFHLGCTQGFFNAVGDVTIDDVKVHLLEADQNFATQQATNANYTS